MTQIEDNLADSSQKVFDMQLKSASIDEWRQGLDGKINNIDATRERLDLALIKVEGNMVKKGDYETHMEKVK